MINSEFELRSIRLFQDDGKQKLHSPRIPDIIACLFHIRYLRKLFGNLFILGKSAY